MKNICIVIICLLVSLSSFANNFEYWLNSELESHQESLASLEQETSSDFELNLIRLRVRASLSIELPLVAKGRVRPEVEFYFSK